MQALAALTLGITLTTAASAAEITFENDLVRWTIGPDGQNVSLVERGTGQEWMPEPGGQMFAVGKGGQTFDSTAVQSDGSRLSVDFGTAGVKAEYRITARPRYFVVELVDVQGAAIDELRLAEVLTSVRGRFGGSLNVAWNNRFAVCVMALDNRVHSAKRRAVVYPEYGMKGLKAAILAVPTPDFLDVVQEVERDFDLPSPTLGGQWAKTSEDVRTSYLFTDLTEANADETIRLARLGGFKYVMMYASTWCDSWGAAPIKTKYYPNGEAGLKAVVDKCHAAGLKVGMHNMTSMIGKTDPLVTPVPDGRLLKNIWATLATDVDAHATDIQVVESLTEWPGQPAYYGAVKQGLDIQIDDEIIQYRRIAGPDGRTFVDCLRGQSGTTPTAHTAGAKIGHLAEWFRSYIVDLRTPLKDVIADRLAGVVNRCGFDMIYFDGNNGNMLNGPRWHWATLQETAVWERFQREVLVQTGGMTHWTWHIQARGACDDFAALAPKQYLDHHKIADGWQGYTSNFLPPELGWWGFLADAPEHPATSPDEVELYAARMLALDCPVSLETNMRALKLHGRTEELLELLGRYERLRLARAVPDLVRRRLLTGEWRIDTKGSRVSFRPAHYDTQRVQTPGRLTVQNQFGPQPLGFRLRVVPTLAAPGASGNKVLFSAKPAVELKLPKPGAAMPGAVVARIEFGVPAADQKSAFVVGPDTELAVAEGTGGLDLLAHRSLAIRLRVEGAAPTDKAACAVLNVQLESVAQMYRDHYVDLDFSGEKTIVIPEPTAERMLAEFRPAASAYSFKHAGYHFKYPAIMALNFRWMRLPEGSTTRCAVSLVEALEESPTAPVNLSLKLGGCTITIPGPIESGDYAEFSPGGAICIFDRNWTPLRSIAAPERTPLLAVGENRIDLSSESPATVKLTPITLGTPVSVPR